MSNYYAEITIPRPPLHAKQREIFKSKSKRIMMCMGRRFGKTFIEGTKATDAASKGKRVIYAAPTADQTATFWTVCTMLMRDLIDAGIVYVHNTNHIMKLPNGGFIRARTAWTPDAFRGDYADLFIFDEFQDMAEIIWEAVASPMLMDNDGVAMFSYTPPGLKKSTLSKAIDFQHAPKLMKWAEQQPDWDTFRGTSWDNPILSRAGLERRRDEARRFGGNHELYYRTEIMAEDLDAVPGAFWNREMIQHTSYSDDPPEYSMVVVAIDPAFAGSGTAGIIVVGSYYKGTVRHYEVIADYSIDGSLPQYGSNPFFWTNAARQAYAYHNANAFVVETNHGGESVVRALQNSALNDGDAQYPVAAVRASEGKDARAEPIATLYSMGLVKHHPDLGELETEMCSWVKGSRRSPNRLDAAVWGVAYLSESFKMGFVA